MIMKLGMEHHVLKLYKVYINDDPDFTMTHFKTMSNLVKLVFVQVDTCSRPRYQVSIYRTIVSLVCLLGILVYSCSWFSYRQVFL